MRFSGFYGFSGKCGGFEFGYGGWGGRKAYKHKADANEHTQKSSWKKAKWNDRRDDDRDEGGRHEDDRSDDFGGWSLKHFGSKKFWKKKACNDDDAPSKGCGSSWKSDKWEKACSPDPEPEQPEVDPNVAPTIVEPTQTSIGLLVAQAGASVTTVVAEDLDGDTLEFSIVAPNDGDSADGDLFLIDAETGVLSLAGDLAPLGSADGDAVYEVEVLVSDGELNDTVALDIITFTAG